MKEVNGRIYLDKKETEKFLDMFYHPSVEAVEKRDRYFPSEVTPIDIDINEMLSRAGYKKEE